MIRDLIAGRPGTMTIQLQDPATRQEYERDPGLLVRRGRAARASKAGTLVFIDEVQKVPELLDAAQLLIDGKKAAFVLTGSSARKLRKAGGNLLPGRIKNRFLDPLNWSELSLSSESRIGALRMPESGAASAYSLEESMIYGSLPGIAALEDEADRRDFLRAYASLYLEEEIRAEGTVRKVGAFSRFLELAANESGASPNLSKLAMEAGVSVPTIKEFYAILEETLVAERVDPYLKNARKRILSTPRYYLFDLGVRNALARLPLERALVTAQKGILFEHAVILEIIRRIRALGKKYRVCFWRTSGGAEVDCIVDTGGGAIPIEIKAAARVRPGDVRGLASFLEEYREVAREGWVITQGNAPEKLSENITAIPWNHL